MDYKEAGDREDAANGNNLWGGVTRTSAKDAGSVLGSVGALNLKNTKPNSTPDPHTPQSKVGK